MTSDPWRPRQWDPTEWQTHCEQLLTMHYGVDVQLIPDRVQGDGGLEAYVARQATAFQCYAPEDPISVATQTAGQKSKITTDTSKLLRRSEATARLIGSGNVIRRWVLLTPAIDDKTLVEHANMRSRKIRDVATDHAWCAEDFRISVHTDDLFAAELVALSAARPSVVALNTDSIDPRTMLAEPNFASYEETLAYKLVADPRLAANEDARSNYATETLQAYFRGSREMERLQHQTPTLHLQVTRCAALIFEGLNAALVENDGRPTVIVASVRTQLFGLLAGTAGLRDDLAMLLARYFIASWWLQCPLIFET